MVTCYCDATIALPLLTHALAERITDRQHAPTDASRDVLFR
jgi:hypothetical protein